MKLHYQNVNTNKLHDELIAAGIRPWPVESKGNDVYIGMPDDTPKEVLEQIAASVAAHNPTPVPVVDADLELVAAIQSATTLEELKNALLGKTKQAQVKARTKEAV